MLNRRGVFFTFTFLTVNFLPLAEATKNEIHSGLEATNSEGPGRQIKTPLICSTEMGMKYIGKDLRFEVAEQIGSDVALSKLAAFADEKRLNYRITHFLNPQAFGPEIKRQFSLIQLYRGNKPIEGAWDVSYISTGKKHDDGGGPTPSGWFTIDDLKENYVSASYPKGDDPDSKRDDGGALMLQSMGFAEGGAIRMHSRYVSGYPESHGCVGLQAPHAANSVPPSQIKSEDQARINEQADAHKSELAKSFMWYSIVKDIEIDKGLGQATEVISNPGREYKLTPGSQNGLVHIVNNSDGLSPEFIDKISKRLKEPMPNTQVAMNFGLSNFKTNGKFYANAMPKGMINNPNGATFRDGAYKPDSGARWEAPRENTAPVATRNTNVNEGDVRVVDVNDFNASSGTQATGRKPGFFNRVFGGGRR